MMILIKIDRLDEDIPQPPRKFFMIIEDNSGDICIQIHRLDSNSLERLSMALDSLIEGRSESEMIQFGE